MPPIPLVRARGRPRKTAVQTRPGEQNPQSPNQAGQRSNKRCRTIEERVPQEEESAVLPSPPSHDEPSEPSRKRSRNNGDRAEADKDEMSDILELSSSSDDEADEDQDGLFYIQKCSRRLSAIAREFDEDVQGKSF